MKATITLVKSFDMDIEHHFTEEKLSENAMADFFTSTGMYVDSVAKKLEEDGKTGDIIMMTYTVKLIK